jgi:pimeloyl-ACP methyl ester carboxylesterase
MILTLIVLLALVAGIGALITVIGTAKIEQAHPPRGRFVEVPGGRLHVVELGEARADVPTIVMIHGASGNLEDLRPLAERLNGHRVILIDRPGHGWSKRFGGADDAKPERHAELIAHALTRLGAQQVVLVAHSLGGAVTTAFAFADPGRVTGLVLLAPVTHPWSTGIAWYYTLTAMKYPGTLFAYTAALPIGALVSGRVVDAVFSPNPAPPDYAERTGISMVLRPSEFIANAQDVAVLLDYVKRKSPHYAELKMPISIVTGDSDDVVSANIHSRAFAKAVPQAELTVLPNTGHMPHYAAPDVVVNAIEKIVRTN